MMPKNILLATVVIIVAGLTNPISSRSELYNDEEVCSRGDSICLARQAGLRRNIGYQIAKGLDQIQKNVIAKREQKKREDQEAATNALLENRINQINRSFDRGELSQTEAEEKIYNAKIQQLNLWQQKTTDAKQTQAMKDQAYAIKQAGLSQKRAIENAAYEQAQAMRQATLAGGLHCTTRTDSYGHTSYTDCY